MRITKQEVERITRKQVDVLKDDELYDSIKAATGYAIRSDLPVEYEDSNVMMLPLANIDDNQEDDDDDDEKYEGRGKCNIGIYVDPDTGMPICRDCLREFSTPDVDIETRVLRYPKRAYCWTCKQMQQCRD